ncbi:MAG TPA: cupredoxin domain-containing protein [candidate division Zixibacteria bacterium]|nr:cupredoxin domain-containing protein [candidate division Zixibacteria bacterium]
MTKNPRKTFRDVIDCPSSDGVDRRGFLQCMAWAGAGLIWTVAGGVPVSNLLGASPHKPSSGFTFAQISDSHIGFDKPANTDVTATLQTAIDKINALPSAPDLIIHTGDISHLAKPGEFDTATQVLKGAKSNIFYVPGEHDVATDNGQQYHERFGKDAVGAGWHSFDHKGVHFVGLVNVVDLKAGGLGTLGHEQLEWMEKDLKGRTSSTPVVVFAHIPLWAVYPEWGWGTQDSQQALSYLKHFGSVTVLNGHIHQIMQKVEGNVTFHTAMATAFPQPVPGTSKSPGPLKVPADELRRVLGISEVNYAVGQHHLAVVDASLAGTPTDQASDILRKAAASATAASQQSAGQAGMVSVTIDNFAFSPKDLTVKSGSTVEWTNKDDTPHTVTSNDGAFGSGALDTNQKFKYTFAKAGNFPYYCKFHPKMTGTVTVQ